MQSRNRLHPASGGIMLASIALSLALTGTGVAGAGATPSADTDPVGVVFTSAKWPYSLELPPEWRVVPGSQEPGWGSDVFALDEVNATVASGIPDPGQTVADRVAFNRATEVPPECTTDPVLDQDTSLGGEPAIKWSWRCPTSLHVAIHTIHDGRTHRLAVPVPIEHEGEASPILERLRAHFTLLDDAGITATTDPVDLVGIEGQLQGTWVTDWYPVGLALATIRTAGL